MSLRRAQERRPARASAIEPGDELHGEHRVECPRRGVVSTTVSGRLSVSTAEALRIDFAAASVRAHAGGRTKLAAFHDWEALTGYEGEARVVLHGLLSDGRDAFEATHILLGPSLVAMGIGVTAALLGKRVTCHVRRDVWTESMALWPEAPPR
jgi:hypothetical protein